MPPFVSDLRPLHVRILERIQTDEFGCWEWIGKLNDKGYGVIRKNKSVDPKQLMNLTHRVVYEALVGDIPIGLEIDHVCRNRKCCNPKHLEPVTRRENILRGEAPAAVNARKTHCNNGHPLFGGNLRIDGLGRRICIICRRIAVNKYDTKKRLECSPVS